MVVEWAFEIVVLECVIGGDENEVDDLVVLELDMVEEG